MALTTIPLLQGQRRQTRDLIKEMHLAPLTGLCALGTKPWTCQSLNPLHSSPVRES